MGGARGCTVCARGDHEALGVDRYVEHGALVRNNHLLQLRPLPHVHAAILGAGERAPLARVRVRVRCGAERDAELRLRPPRTKLALLESEQPARLH